MKFEIPFKDVGVCEIFELKSTRKPAQYPNAADAYLHCTAMKIQSVLVDNGDDSAGALRNMLVVKVFEDRFTLHVRETKPGELQICGDEKLVTVERPPSSGS